MPRFFLFTEIGIGVTGFGLFFLFFGVIFFFDKGLLAIGNVSFRLHCEHFFYTFKACAIGFLSSDMFFSVTFFELKLSHL